MYEFYVRVHHGGAQRRTSSSSSARLMSVALNMLFTLEKPPSHILGRKKAAPEDNNTAKTGENFRNGQRDPPLASVGTILIEDRPDPGQKKA
ncbi:YALI0B11286p [Anopheles sinensis]|uniref:YALI0B11286p n=1 Tax=Anopheles sinensis TaxID=74873 RepID=A0A084VKV7_ANOSI|nr:YALI0B11286p [Anopheles sinensis]